MTVNEAINYLEDAKIEFKIPKAAVTARKTNEALDMAIKALKQMNSSENQGNWIPCSERLPEVGQDILMSVGGMYTAEGCLREDGDWAQFRWDTIQRKDMVGAWMPLPKPYEEEDNDRN